MSRLLGKVEGVLREEFLGLVEAQAKLCTSEMSSVVLDIIKV